MARNIYFGLLAVLASFGATAAIAAPPIEVKVVVVTMFEIGEDTGDTAGEFQLWRERQKLNERLPFAHHHDLYLNRETGVLGMVTGMGTANSATAVMALGLDPRFDLSKSYWLIAGIAGVDPADASIGSAAWAEYLGGWRPCSRNRLARNSSGLADGLLRTLHSQALRSEEARAHG